MDGYHLISLGEQPQWKKRAAAWFHEKWGVPQQAYLDCMEENDFHQRTDLAPNLCAVYTEPEYRRQGIAGRLLARAVADLRAQGIAPVYLLTDLVGFYERYGWAFFCMAQCTDAPICSRIYIHR